MATGAIVGGVAAAAGGTAAAIRAQRMKTDPRGVVYGGSTGVQNGLLDQYGNGVDQGNGYLRQGMQGLAGVDHTAGQLVQTGQEQGAQTFQAAPTTTRGMSVLDAYRPGQVSAAQSQATIDQGAAANLGGARAGGLTGIRAALVANAGSNTAAAQNMAMQRAAEQQAYVQQQVQQANADRAQGFAAEQAAIGNTQAQQQIGNGLTLGALGQRAGANGQIVGAGLNNQGQYLGQQQNVLDTQNANNLTIEQIRQANQARKSNNLMALGGQMFGIAGKAFSSGAGGGG